MSDNLFSRTPFRCLLLWTIGYLFHHDLSGCIVRQVSLLFSSGSGYVVISEDYHFHKSNNAHVLCCSDEGPHHCPPVNNQLPPHCPPGVIGHPPTEMNLGSPPGTVGKFDLI